MHAQVIGVLHVKLHIGGDSAQHQVERIGGVGHALAYVGAERSRASGMDRTIDVPFGLEAAVYRRQRDSGGGGHRDHLRRLVAVLGEDLLGGIENVLSV